MSEAMGPRPLLVWVSTTYDDGQPRTYLHLPPEPRYQEFEEDAERCPEVRHAYALQTLAEGAPWHGVGFGDRLCGSTSLGDPLFWLSAHPELRHRPRCPFCMAIVVAAIERAILASSGEYRPDRFVSYPERVRTVACAYCGAKPGMRCVGKVKPRIAGLHVSRKKTYALQKRGKT